MKVLGITGGVGAGKSTVLNYLSKTYGARTIQADEVAHMLQEPGEDCYYKIIETFGSSILNEDQTINRKKLAEIVFTDKKKLEKLNHIIHPAVKSYIVSQIEWEKERKEVPFVVIEAALLIEDHYDLICHAIWYIYAREQVRIERLIKTRGYTEEKVRNMIQNQLSDEKFRSYCQFVVDNSSDFVDNTYEQIDRGIEKYEFL